MNIVYETDWLGTNPVFYNEKNLKVSHNINEVIDYRNLEFDPEGFNNFLEFGYSVFGQTPVKHVKFLEHSSILELSNNKISITKKEDPVEKIINHKLSEEDVINLIKQKINIWENSFSDEIIIPTSGGYDSRLLNFLVNEKSRIKSFTYGISKNQEKSYETVYAKRLSEILKTDWQNITIGNFHNYLEDWDRLFGTSTHAHGMYQMEFYNEIKKITGENKNVLSGIIGDAWAGSVKVPEIKNSNQLISLGYTHGMRADKDQSLLSSNTELKHIYFENNKSKLNDPLFRIIEAMRFKIILLSYLTRVPSSMGFIPWSPFLDIEISLSMLNLPKERRENRNWQKDFFTKNKIDLENQKLKIVSDNQLNLSATKNVPLLPLDINLLGELINKKYIEWINRNISLNWRKAPGARLLQIPKIRGAILKYNIIKNNPEKEFTNAYNAYMTIKPIETLLKKRNQA